MDKVILTGDNRVEIVNTWAHNVDKHLFSVDKPVETNTFQCELLR